jgi:hypothetical protein
MELIYPIFVRAKDCGDVLRFESVYEMQQQLEQIDVENHEYEAWDSRGLPLDLKAQKPVWLSIEPKGSEVQPGELGRALKEYGSRVGVELVLARMDAPEFDEAFGQIKSHIKTQGGRKGILGRIFG